MNHYWIILLFIGILLTGCSTPVVSSSSLKQYESSSSFSQLWYIGSDEKHHYFLRNELSKVQTRCKVAIEELHLEKTFGIETQKPYVIHPGTIEKAQQAAAVNGRGAITELR